MRPDNPVVRLCAAGMRAEAEGQDERAHDLFERAWQQAGDDYEACIAAHYLARHRPTPEDTLRWNAESLRRARLADQDAVAGFLASLHLNTARSHRDLGDDAAARAHFEAAAGHLAALPAGPYADWTRNAVAEGLRATGALPERDAEGPLRRLLAALCARADLVTLGLLLPSWLGDLGTEEDRTRLLTVLNMAHASRRLPAEDLRTLRDALAALSPAPQQEPAPASGSATVPATGSAP
ncbi:hypothetical protein [Streptomyces sp. NHF165]|uniref:hypothetical protein n=1 Tax=Streptomyces sp. NHF165 TaxID=2175864 RepID=UPI00191784E6|nr:hypothetical protein [Streptomyces sp. NHF165]